MENIYKVKVKSHPDPSWLYPSERRYSASTVLGLGVVHIALACAGLLLGCVSITADEYQNPSRNLNPEGFNFTENRNETLSALGNFYICLTIAPCISCIGALCAGLTGLLAWKRWYIDHNISLFFFTSIVSTATSFSALITTMTVLILVSESSSSDLLPQRQVPNFKFVIAINVLIASILELLWSILSLKIAFKGMKNCYPDDIVISKSRRGKVQVSTVTKGNKKAKMVPPDIIRHFPVDRKIARHLPRRNPNNLPKEESHAEYQERVNKFLASKPTGD